MEKSGLIGKTPEGKIFITPKRQGATDKRLFG